MNKEIEQDHGDLTVKQSVKRLAGLIACGKLSKSGGAISLMQNASIHGVMDCIEDKQGDTDARPG